MSKIEAIIGGKQKGIADQVTIDPALGCKNRCVGCYAFKSSQRGKKYYEKVVEKEFDEEVLKRSLRKVKAKGHYVARIGKHSEPGDHFDRLNDIIDCCSNERFRCVVVSKTLQFTKEFAQKLRDGDHTLHISIGPFSDRVPTEKERLDVARSYETHGVNVSIRWTVDITRFLRPFIETSLKEFNYIITPLRYYSKKVMRFYGARQSDYEFRDGYYKPKVIHPDWKPYMDKVCGEINKKTRCCNCNIEK